MTYLEKGQAGAALRQIEITQDMSDAVQDVLAWWRETDVYDGKVLVRKILEAVGDNVR